MNPHDAMHVRSAAVAAMRVWSAAVAAIAVGWGQTATAAPVDVPPGVCWRNTVENTSYPITQPDIKTFCWHLQGAVRDHLRAGRNQDALARFVEAERAAAAIQDQDQRNLALDEARGAIALAVEPEDWRYALALLDPARNRSGRDVLALERAYMLTRLELFAEAAAEFERARRELAAHWCPETEADYQVVRARAAGDHAGSIGNKTDIDLPSYLPYRIGHGECGGKAAAVRVPRGHTFSVDFDSGQSQPKTSSAATLAEMARFIAASPEQQDPAKWQWVLVGHTDEQCYQERFEFCRSDNRQLSQRRAEDVRKRLAELLRQANVDGIRFRIDPRGMDDPMHPGGIGHKDPRNRRVYLTPEPVRKADATISRQCPWEVAVIRADLPPDMHRDGVTASPRVPVSPGIIPVRGQVAFSLRLIAEAADPAMRHFYALSENPATEIANLGGLAGLTSSGFAALVPRKGYVLADGREFMTDRDATEETISLYVSDVPIPGWENLRTAPAVPTGTADNGMVEITGRHSLVTVNGKTASLALLGHKEWGPLGGFDADATPSAQVLRHQPPPSPAIPAPTPATLATPAAPAIPAAPAPVAAAPMIAKCSFTFLVR